MTKSKTIQTAEGSGQTARTRKNIMYKAEMKAIADKYGMTILRDHITNEAFGLRLESRREIPELEIICGDYHDDEVGGKCARYDLDDGKFYIYTIYCPTVWFDLYGWR